jgi:hypothetical protein
MTARASVRMRVFAAASFVSLLVTSSFAQDLAAVARKEKERRAKVAKPAKVLTENEVKEGQGSVTVTVAGTAEDAPSAASPASPPAVSAEEASRASWKARALAARQAVLSAESGLKSLEDLVTTLRADLAPLTAQEAQDPLRIQKRDARIAETNQAIEKQKIAIADAKKALVAFEQEARDNRVPPGWLR